MSPNVTRAGPSTAASGPRAEFPCGCVATSLPEGLEVRACSRHAVVVYDTEPSDS